MKTCVQVVDSLAVLPPAADDSVANLPHLPMWKTRRGFNPPKELTSVDISAKF
jgi:hypothetical protein